MPAPPPRTYSDGAHAIVIADVIAVHKSHDDVHPTLNLLIRQSGDSTCCMDFNFATCADRDAYFTGLVAKMA